MKTWKIITIATLATLGVALITTAAFAVAYNPYRNMAPTQGYGWMMDGWTDQQTNTPANGPYANSYGGFGCRGQGYRYNYATSTSNNAYGTPLTIEQATTGAEQYVTTLNNPDLKIGEVEEYANNFYVQVYEESTGTGAFELLVDKYTGNVYPEMGPNRMWNTAYTTETGMRGFFNGFCGIAGFQRTTNTPMTVTTQQAAGIAQQYLDTYLAGTTVGDVTTFHGYYTIEIESGGEHYGMLSVNGYTGQVWFHNWHGTFVQEQTVD